MSPILETLNNLFVKIRVDILYFIWLSSVVVVDVIPKDSVKTDKILTVYVNNFKMNCTEALFLVGQDPRLGTAYVYKIQ